MKKYLLNLLLLVAFALPFATQAQVTLTVHDGTATNNYVPVYGFYCDDFVKCQSVYPASELVMMSGGQITGLTYYASTVPGSWGASTFKVYLMEVANATISSYADYTNATVVYSGALSATSGTMDITFSTPYTYTGGNLLIGIQSLTDGTYSSVYWFGETVTGASVRGYNSSSADGSSASVQNFLPKTTFSYVPGEQSCPMVSNFNYANLTARGVDLSWTAGGTEGEWEITITPAVDDIDVFYASDTTYSFTDLIPETNYRVSCRAICSDTDTSYASSISFRTPVSCPPVSGFGLIEKSSTTATISWNAGGEETEWVGTINPAIDDVAEWYSTDTLYAFENLTPETNYTFTVRAVCGPEDTSVARTYNFYTGYCSPYFSDLDGDGITNVSFGMGDTVVNQNIYAPAPYYVNNSDIVGQMPAGMEGTVNITFNTGYDYGTIIWVDWNNNLTFDGNEVVYVGESSSDEPTVLQASFLVPDTMPLGHYRMRIAAADSYYDSYTSSIAAAANANPCPNASWGTAIDFTISVTEAPSCLPVNGVVVHNFVTVDSVYATWNAAGTASQWDLVLSTSNVEPGDDAEVLTAYDTNYLFDPLVGGTTYYLFVRSNCGGDVSNWSIPVSFVPGLYLLAGTGSDTITGCGFAIRTQGYPNSYPNNANSTLVIYPSTADSAIRISGTFESESGWDYLDVYDGVGTSAPLLGSYTGSTANVGPFIGSTGPITVNFSSDGSGNDFAGANLAVSCVYLSDCTAPSDVMVNLANGDTVALSWTSNGSTSFDIAYGPAGFDVENVDDDNIVAVSDTTYTFTGLPLGVNYDFYVRANCGSEQSFWIGPVGAMTGYFYSMHSGSDTLSNACGYIVTDNGGPNGPYASYFDGTLVLLPPAGQTLVVSGTSYTESSWDYLTIYDGVGTTGAVLFCDNISGVSSTIPFGPFTSDEGAITITFHSDGSNQYDGFSMAVQCVAASSCTRPNQLAINSLDNESVTLSWNERGEATSWVIEYGPTGFTPGSEDGTIVNVSTNPYTISGLTANTSYDAYVSSDCGGEQSAPTAISFRTACNPIDSLPYFYGFEDATGTSSSAQINSCWNRLSDYNSGYPYPSSTARTGNRSMYFYSYDAASCLVMPLFDEPLANLQLKFALKRASSSSDTYYNFGMKVGVMTDPNDMNTFTEITTVQATSNSVWDTFTVYLANYTGEGQYIAFMDNNNASQYYTYLYLDDITVDFAPECGPVENLTAVGGITTALVSWTPSAVGEYSGATVEYKTDAAEEWTSVQATENYIALTGLDTNSNYTVRVINNCTDGVGAPVTTTFSTNAFGCIYDPTTLINATIGDGSVVNTYVPAYSFYNNALTQQIYLANEIDADSGAAITQISFQLGNMVQNRTWWIYLTNTNATNLSAGFVTIPATDQVWNGSTAVFTANDWNTIELTTPFVYTGGNIMVTFRDNTGNYTSGNQGIVTSTNHADITRYAYDDGVAFNPTTSTWSSSSYTTSDRLNMRFFGGNCMATSTCGAPLVMVNGVTPYTVDLVWAPGNDESSWIVEYRASNDEEWTLAGTATAPQFTIAGLSQGTNYQARVINPACTDSLSTTVRFTTECALISSLPYTETFSSWPVSSIPNCWSREGSYSTYGNISTSYNHSGVGGGAIYTYSSSSSNYTTYTTLPEIDTTEYSINDLQVVFYAYNPSTSYSVNYAIGVMTNQNNPNTFRAIDTVSVTEVGSWQIFEVPLSNYNLASDTGVFISIKSCYLSTYGYGYIDDITVEQIPTCPRPDSLMATNATSSSVDLSWRERGSANDWVIEYGPVGFQLGTGTTVSANSNPFTLTGVPASFDGEFYVRSVCSSTDSGEYSRVACRFSTSQVPATLPYVYDFENATEWANWQTNSNSDINWYRGNADAGDGSYSMYISADEGVTVGNNGFSSTVNASAYRDVDFGTVDSSFTFSFKAKVGGTTTAAYDALMVFLVDPSVPVVAPTANITSPWGSVNNLYRIATVRLDTTWQTYEASFDHISGVQRVAFFWFNQNTASSEPFIGGPAEVDSITIDYSACPRPTDLDTVAVAGHSATLTWNGPANGSYLFVYREYPNGNTLDTLYTNTNSITVNGLPAATTYICAAQKICGADTSLLSDAILFTTKCDVMLASEVYTEDFEGYTEASYSEEGDVPNCWVVYSNGTSTAYTPHVTNYSSYCYPNSGVGALTLTSGSSTYGDTKIAALPVFAEPLNTLTMKFYYRMESTLYGTLTVGYVTDDSDLPGSFVAVKTISTTTDITQDSVTFDSITAAGRIAFKWEHNNSYYSCGIDDIVVESSFVGCQAPTIVSNSNTYNSFTATWNGSSDSYEVSYMSVSDADYSTPVAVSANTYTLTGLTPATQYSFRVRALCDSGAVSGWTSVNFTTDSLPCFVPEDLHQTAIAYTSVTLDWTNGGNEQNWVVKVFNSRIGEILDTVATHPVTINGLAANEQYFASVQAACGSNLDGFSDWSDTISFTTTECVAVSNISCGTPSQASVFISWTANGSESAWVIAYGVPGFGQGEEIGSVVATANPFELSVVGLEPNTTYEVYVYAQCAEGLNSIPAGPASFTTNDIGISGISGNADINIYPNPTTGSTTISVSGISGKVNVAIVDMNGREVMNSAMECDGDCEKVMNVEGLAQGAYFVRIYGEEINSIRKLIVR